MHAPCSLRKLPQGIASKQPRQCWGKASAENWEVHFLQKFPSAFQRAGFIPLSCEIPWAESYSNCWAGPRGTAGPQRECRGCHSIRAGSVAVGRCGRSVTEEAVTLQECNVTSLEPLPARQQGHPLAPPRQTSLSAPKWTTASGKSSRSALEKVMQWGILPPSFCVSPLPWAGRGILPIKPWNSCFPNCFCEDKRPSLWNGNTEAACS